MLTLPEQIKLVSKDGSKAKFEISPLMPGYGATIANPLRRVLLSSLEGGAVTAIKIKGVDHEFSNFRSEIRNIPINARLRSNNSQSLASSFAFFIGRRSGHGHQNKRR